MEPLISVIICTHNPRSDYLARVLKALAGQALPLDQWELLLIDNASNKVLAEDWDLSWHPHARHIREDELGLTPARLRGIRESTGALLLFVDDDNVLATDYLECAIQITNECPHIGAFGGSIKGEFETAPEPWALPYLSLLAIREIERDSWSNLLTGWNESSPAGAGLCVRRSVAQDYWRKILADSRRRALDRVGTGTGSSGDVDLAYCAIDLGMGMGTFCRLRLTHLIPKKRLTVEYIARLSAGISASIPVVRSLRPTTSTVARNDRLASIRSWVKLWATIVTCSRIDRKIALAVHAGRRSGQRFLEESSGDRALIQH